MNNSFIQKLISLVEANLANENFGPEDLAKEAGISRSNLNRKLRFILNQNSSQFIREIRLKKAKELLRNEELTIAEVSYRVGFGSPTYFSSCFHEFYGHAPSEHRNQVPENEPEEQPVEPISIKRKPAKILIGLLVGLIVLIPFSVFLIKKGSKNTIKEKSIAVLPFVNYSPEEGTTYIINGLQEEILDKLEKIEDLRVKSRTSVEKYKDTKLSISTIAKELKVNYILEGSGQKFGNNIRIRLQLIETESGNHLWSKPFEEEVNDKTIFDIQEKVALSVADELGAILSPDEKTQMTKKPTQNPAAYNYYLRGIEYMKLHGSSHNWDELYKAKQNFELAIKLDSTFAEAYVRLASIYINILASPNQTISLTRYELLWQQNLDSGLMMANKALLYDEKNSWAYWLRGTYYEQTGLLEKAEEEFAKNAQLEKKSKTSSRYMEYFFRFYNNEDYYNALVYFFKYQETRTEELESERTMLHHACVCFGLLGFPELAKLYARKFLEQYNDSMGYFQMAASYERTVGNFESAENFQLKCHKIDSTNTLSLYCLLFNQVGKRDYKSAYKYVIALENEYLKTGRDIEPEILSGYIYLKNGDTKKADYHLKGSEQKLLKEIESNWINSRLYYSYWNLAKIYSIMGEKRKALDNLKMLKNRKTDYLFLVNSLNYYPFFDIIRDEPEFIEVVKDVEAKYQAEHDRVGKWLKEKGLM
jgi:TolB-like protein/AraC-like DNA-binding protein